MKLLSGAEISCPLSVLERVGVMEVFLRKYMRISRDIGKCPK